ncbi:MAG: hypothetical protein HQL12_02880 [Candidatus Omnitrophica bacterium]|nr:hypothetical protein [Candidatus Omnitrophota bacterium]
MAGFKAGGQKKEEKFLILLEVARHPSSISPPLGCDASRACSGVSKNVTSPGYD